VFFAPRFRKQFRVIVPDLPGFGDTGYLPGKSYTLDAQVARLKDFVDVLHLDRVHLVGNSMGGYIAAAFAARHPEKVATLGLFNAAGVDMPRRSRFYAAALEGHNLLLTRSRADFEAVLALVYHRKPWLPGYLKHAMAVHRIAVAEDQDIIFRQIFGQRVWLDKALPRITAPTLILWGDHDQVLDISSVPLFKQGIPHADVAIIPACGHVPMLERPFKTAAVYRRFLARHGITGTADATGP
jgi:pimeloyl-ACP methyl ester carboxylesterase